MEAMIADPVQWWVPLASGVIGAGVTVSGAVFVQWRTSSGKRREPRNESQRETLEELQEALLKIWRGAAKGEDYTLPWKRSKLLSSRVSDEGVRQLTDEFKSAIPLKAKNMDELFDRVNDRIGEILPSLH